jgi:hypothetical protein
MFYFSVLLQVVVRKNSIIQFVGSHLKLFNYMFQPNMAIIKSLMFSSYKKIPVFALIIIVIIIIVRSRRTDVLCGRSCFARVAKVRYSVQCVRDPY